jgi:FAD/FMN-containing dehydrogenase
VSVPTPTRARPGAAAAEALRGLCGGAVHLPGDREYDAARMPWNVAVDQRPAAVAYPASAAEVAEVVRAATAAGLRVAPQGTGHNAGPLGNLDDVVLLRTSAMTGVTIDAERGRARVQAGTLWLDVVEAAAKHGLTVLHGSSPDVGVVGYSLGGGMGWYARALGLQTNTITAAEIVTADGHILRIDADHEPDLFWALRGGGGNVGIVTELEFRTFDFDTAYAGWLVWDAADADRVLRAWAAWSVDAPDCVTTSFRLLRVPPIEEMPEPFRGRHLVVIDGAVMGDNAHVLDALRAEHPELDTFASVPTETLVRLHMDPEGPTPAVSQTSVLATLPDEAIDAFLAAAADTGLLMIELRQLGGALGRPAEDAGALACIDGQFVLLALTMAITPEMGAQGQTEAQQVVDAVAAWSNGRSYLNFAEGATDVSTGYRPETWARLQQVRATVDPHGVLKANHGVPTAPRIPQQR